MKGQRWVRYKIWIVLWGMILVLAGCGAGVTERVTEGKEVSNAEGSSEIFKSSVEISSELLRYKNITYGEFCEENESEAEFLHATFYSAQIDDTEIYAVFSGEYDEETAGPVLTDDAVCIRLEGKLGTLLTGMDGEMDADDLALELVQGWKDLPPYYKAEGAGTAYYVADRYMAVEIDSDWDLEEDTVLEIPLDESDKVSPDSYAWVRWESSADRQDGQ